MLILSILNLSFISTFIQSNFTEVDERVIDYLGSTENDFYQKTGFRYDFLLYSFYPIILGYYYIYIQKFRDTFYEQIYSMYLLLNSFWLIVIRIPFNDRFAYFSWFWMPFLLLYPLCRQQIFNHQYQKVALIIFSILLLNFALNILR